MSWLKRHLPKKRRYRVCLYILSVLLMVLAADMALVQYWRRVTIAPETTRITAPLLAAGYPDYLAAMNTELSQGVTAENNAAVLLVELVPERNASEQWRKAVRSRLGLPETPAVPGPAVVGFEDWLKQQGPASAPQATTGKEEGPNLMREPWRSADHPARRQWLDAHAAALELVHRAVARERYYLPMVLNSGTVWSDQPGQVIAVLLPNLGTYREAARMLVTRAMLRLGEGDTAGFEADVTAACKLARLVAQGPTLVEQLVAYAIDGLAQQATQQAAISGRLDAAAATRLVGMLATLPRFDALGLVIDRGERYCFLDAVCMVAQRGASAITLLGHSPDSGTGDGTVVPAMRQFLVPLNCDKALRTGNAIYDRYVRAFAEPTYLRQQAGCAAIEKDLQALHDRSIAPALDLEAQLVTLLVPSLPYVNSCQEQAQMQRDLSMLALRLRLYQMEHHAYPAALAELGAPAALLNDGFVDRPLVYRRDGAGYVLYSVGIDGKDDGGRARDDAKGVQGWDLVVRAEK